MLWDMHRDNRNRHASKGAVTLGDIVGRVRMLEIACRHCERHGWLSVARLVEEHGADLTLPYLRERLAGDCSPGFSRHRSMSAVAPTSRSRRPRTSRRARHLLHPAWLGKCDN